jgi:hypothetical protein
MERNRSKNLRNVLAGILAGALLMTAPAVSAAVGDLLGLGEVNRADRTTVLRGVAPASLKVVNTDPAGTTLDLRVRAGNPPLKVNSNARVPRLNADLLDGKHASYFLPRTRKAADSNLLDGLDSSDLVAHGEIQTTVSGNAWLRHDDGPVSMSRWAASTTFSSDGSAVISLAGPALVGGVDYGLASFELCLITFGSGFVDAVYTVPIESFGPGVDDDQYIVIPPDTADRTTGCYTYTVNSPIGQGVGLMVELGGTGSVDLYAVKATWSRAAAVGS